MLQPKRLEEGRAVHQPVAKRQEHGIAALLVDNAQELELQQSCSSPFVLRTILRFVSPAHAGTGARWPWRGTKSLSTSIGPRPMDYDSDSDTDKQHWFLIHHYPPTSFLDLKASSTSGVYT